jgi:hypothetical protein
MRNDLKMPFENLVKGCNPDFAGEQAPWAEIFAFASKCPSKTIHGDRSK